MWKVVGALVLALCALYTPAYSADSTSPPAAASSPAAAQGKIRWYTDYAAAQKEATEKGKRMVLFFTGSDWCVWCQKMQEEIFSSPEFVREMGDRFVFVEVDFPKKSTLSPEQMQQNTALRDRYPFSGYPTVIIAEKDGSYVGQMGYVRGGGGVFADYLKQFISP